MVRRLEPIPKTPPGVGRLRARDAASGLARSRSALGRRRGFWDRLLASGSFDTTRPLAALVLAGALGALAGCRAPAEALSLEMRAPEKDVLVLDVELAQGVAPEEYLAWARESVASFGDIENPYFDAPVYELVYCFHAGARHLATVLYRRTDAGAGPGLEHHRTLVFRPEGGGGR